MTIKHNSHGGERLRFAAKYGFDENQIHDFSVNTFPYPLPDELTTILQNCIPSITQYPDAHNMEFVETVSRVERLPQECIVPLNGSAQGMYALCSMPDIKTVYTFEPTFIEYHIAANAYQKKWIPLPREAVQFQPEFLENIEPDSLLFLCNPNNPDGSCISKDKIIPLIHAVADRKSILVADEAFIEYLPDESVMSLVNVHQNIVVLRSLTKYFGLAGLRCGYMAAHPDFADKICSYIPPWSLNTLSQTAGAWVLTHPNHFHQAKWQWLYETEMLLEHFLSLTCLDTIPSVTNYFMIHFHEMVLAVQFQVMLARKGIMIRNCSNYEGLDSTYFRIGAKDEKSNQYLLDTLQSQEFTEVFQ